MYTLGQAAIAVGKSKATISKAIKSGKISAEKQANGSYRIDPSELHRVYPPNGSETGEVERSATPQKTVENANENMILQVKLDAALETIERLEADKADWKQQAQSLARLMPPDGAGEGPKLSLWSRITGG